MDSTANAASHSASTTRTPAKPSPLARWFYPFAGVVMLICTVLGFQRFYFQGQSYPGRPITPPIRPLIIVHGASMSLWILLGIIQPMLVASGKRKVHMALGRVGVAVAVSVLVLGIMVGVQSARVTPMEAKIMGFNPVEFLAVPLISVIFFAIFVAVAVWYRTRPHIHRAMMLSATMVTISAALNRVDALNNLYIGTVWDRLFGPFFAAVVIGAILVALRCLLIRAIDRPLATGWAIVTLLSAVIVWLARTPAWDSFARMIIGNR